MQKLREMLTSKKFLATLGGCITAASMGDWATVYQLIMLYVGVVGAQDAAHHLTLPSPKAAKPAFPESPSNEALPR